MHRLTRALCAAGIVAATSTAGVPSAGAADGGLLRLAHLSPDTPAVDVYVDSVSDPEAGVTLRGVDYGTVSDYQAVPPGTYTVSMRTAGDDPSTPPVLSTTVEVGTGTARTVAGVGPFADLGLAVLQDDLTLPPTGESRLRVIAAASNAATLDVSLPGNDAVASGLEFAKTSEYVDVPAGRTDLQVTPDGASPAALPVDLAAGSVYSVLVLDRSGGGLTVRTVLDAASPGIVPVGGVATGAGGTTGTTSIRLVAAGIAALATAGLLATVVPRLPRGRRRARHVADS
jgi:hypothetical protein